MKGNPSGQFGIVIAYLLPGFIALAGSAPLVPAVRQWLQPVSSAEFGLGPPVYAVLAATAAGLMLSCLRWILLDHVHRWTGLVRPEWDDRHLDQVLGSFDYLVQSHFRYYEFCGNSFIAFACMYGLNRAAGTLPFLGPLTDAGAFLLLLVLFVASRDALRNYYTRSGRLVGRPTPTAETQPCSTATTTAAPDKPTPSPTPSPHKTGK